jgi:hypothetical protein
MPLVVSRQSLARNDPGQHRTTNGQRRHYLPSASQTPPIWFGWQLATDNWQLLYRSMFTW